MGRALLVSSILEIFILAAARMRQIAGAWDKHVGCCWFPAPIARKVRHCKSAKASPQSPHPALGSILVLLTSFVLRADARVRQALNKLLPRQQARDGGGVCMCG